MYANSIVDALAGAQSGVIAIDGRAASGKTTVAAQLADILGAGVVHMDDFFLPPKLRTAQRLNEPGGNVHYERFSQEVLPYLNSGDSFEYRIFDCTEQDYKNTRKVDASPWRVVEGCYSHHPRLGDYATLRVFFDVDSETQINRIKVRNGEEMAKIFVAKWIPLEERYFVSYGVKGNAQILFGRE